MRDDLVRQAAGRLNDGVPLAEVEDELGVEFTADELVAVSVRRRPYARHAGRCAWTQGKECASSCPDLRQVD